MVVSTIFFCEKNLSVVSRQEEATLELSKTSFN